MDSGFPIPLMGAHGNGIGNDPLIPRQTALPMRADMSRRSHGSSPRIGGTQAAGASELTLAPRPRGSWHDTPSPRDVALPGQRISRGFYATRIEAACAAGLKTQQRDR